MEISVSSLLSKSWNAFKAQWLMAVGLTFLNVGVGCAVNRLTVLGLAISIPLNIGWIRCMVKITGGEVAEFEDLLWPFKNLERYIHALLVGVLVMLGILIGILLLILPGIWFATTSLFAIYYFALGETHCLRAIQRSMAAVKGRWWRAFGALWICLGLVILGTFCLGVGLLAALPVTAIFLLNVAKEWDRGVPETSPLQPPEIKT